MRKLLIFVSMWLPLLAWGQQIPAGFVNVTATVPSLANGTYGAAWTNLSGSSQKPLLGGTSTFQTTVGGQLDSNGKFTVLVADNAQIIPNPSTWTWSLTFHCTGTPPVINGGFMVAIPIIGGGTTQDISAQITAALPSNPCSGGGGGGGGSPSPPAFTVQAANSSATSLTSDPAITINTALHTFNVGGPITTNSVTIGPHAIPAASWTFDTYSPQTACASIGCNTTNVFYCPTSSTVAACIAALPAGGGTVYLSLGTYRSGLDQANPPLSTAHVDIEGSGMPWFNSATAPTALTGGTIIQGTVAVIQGANFFKIRNLGIDVGSTFVNANYGGTPADALSIYNNGQTIGAPQVEAPIVENIVALGYSLSAPNHAILVENVDHAYVHNTASVYNQHGSILKGTNSIWDGDYSRGHSIDSFIIKSDPYAPSATDHVSHVFLEQLATPGDTNGMILSAQDQVSANLTVSNFFIGGMSNNGIQIDGGSTSMSNVEISNGTIDYGGSGSGGSCIGLQNQTNRLAFTNLVCNNYYQGFGASSPSGNDYTLSNSQFTNIGHEALVTAGRWTVTGNKFANVGDHVFYNESGTLAASNNTYVSIASTVFQSVGGSFAGLDAGALGFPDAGFLTTVCGPTATEGFDVQNNAMSTNLLLVDCSGTTHTPALTTNTVTIPGATAGTYVKADGTGYGTPGGSGIANIQITTGTSYAANTCTSNTATSMAGVAITSAIIAPTPTSSTVGVSGWDGAHPALTFSYYVTSGTFNWSVCNGSVSPATPTAITWNVGAQ